MGEPHIFGPGEVHDFIECSPAVILPNGVSLLVADMVVCRDEDTDRVRSFSRSVA
jgi:hypothetical protein